MAICKKFPNTSVTYGARKAGDGYRGYVTCVEYTGWTPSKWSKRSDVTRLTREDALLDAAQAAAAAIETGYVPAF